MIYKDEYSPVFDPNNVPVETGIMHDWQEKDGLYYGPLYQCLKCGKKNWGWNLWKEDFLPNCPGKTKV